MPQGFMAVKEDFVKDGGAATAGDTILSWVLPNGERAVKLSNLAMLWVYAYDPVGNLLHEAGSGSETEAPIIEHIYLGNRLVSSITGYGSACFIASVAYGTPLSEDLDVFRAFRDRILSRMTAGEGMIKWYYAHGPSGAKWLEGHATAKAFTYYTLVAVAVPLKAVMFGHWSILVIIFLCVLGAFVVGRKLGWKRSTSIITSFALAFGSIIVYSFLVDVPVSSASYSERTKYFYTLDHIGRPLNLRDENLYLRWYEQHYPFGEIITEDTPTWDIQAGSGSSTISWTPYFRFPGQLDDSDQYPFVQNHYREYMPELGRYNRVDPVYSFNYSNYGYAANSSYYYYDPDGRSLVHIFIGLLILIGVGTYCYYNCGDENTNNNNGDGSPDDPRPEDPTPSTPNPTNPNPNGHRGIDTQTSEQDCYSIEEAGGNPCEFDCNCPGCDDDPLCCK